MDYLLKDATEKGCKDQASEETTFYRKRLRKRKISKEVWGILLWHIGRNTRGFVAVGFNACGAIAIGLNEKGIKSLGLLLQNLIL